MLPGLRGRWSAKSLRQRLTYFYTGLLVVLLLLATVTVQQLMRQDLERSLEADLADTYAQFVTLSPELKLELEDGTGAGNSGLAEARSRFPSSVLQIDPVVPRSQTQDLSADWATARAEGGEQALLDWVKKQTGALRLRPVGIDPAEPLTLSQDELRQLLESPSRQILINRSVRPQFSDPEPMRVLVALTPLPLQLTADAPPQDMLTITYVGRSLSNMNRTLARLQIIMLGLLLVGSFLAAFGAFALSGLALRPLYAVRRAAESIDSNNLTARVPMPHSNDEVQALAVAFNRMLERLEESFETQRRFTSDASHELRTPVTAIGGHATYLLRRTELDQQQRESVAIIQRESERMTDLIGSLLQLARSDGGVLTMRLQPVFAQIFLHEIVRELSPLADAENAVLRVSGQDTAFEADPDRLRQVLNNLITNALKAGAKHIDLRSEVPKPGYVRLSVRDNGPGIAPDQLEKLFDRFYRLEDSRSRDRGGAGLGLSIARSIVEAHKGRIWLESQAGQGTQAYVELPIGNIPTLDEEDIP
ncbi:sensor histidine kinase [Deinococcus radiophilus]|uniref:histidine kinase n=1 Tax=Deinococcus radiophilus TaxID=32062 RepID=A0A431VTI2_9DEIO|nr:ATP-binding protein [Deinococcus radiophilus]RTR26516.1 HAMP domain-containing protein [Deinococcus radiophilus]UFA50571.1 HAMP domain-containing protein [Deinococcus radiophilus]